MINPAVKYSLKQKEFKAGDLTIRLYQSENLDDYFNQMTEDDFGPDERFPYFVNVWHAGVRLADFLVRFFHGRNLKRKKVLELGSGSGIAGIALSLLNADVTFTDFEEEALDLIRINADLNGITDVKTMNADWRSFPDLGSYDLIIGSDLIYEKRFVTPLSETVQKILKPDNSFIFADPCRNYLEEFLRIMNEQGLATDLLEESTASPEYRIFKIHQIR